MKKNRLEKYTPDELKAEIVRREKSKPLGNDYYYLQDDDNEGSILIVHKRHWHLNHAVDDWANLPELPDEFSCVSECTYEYDGDLERTYEYDGKLSEGMKKLDALGFTKLPEEYYILSLVVHVLRDGYRVDWQCDTQKIKDDFKTAFDHHTVLGFLDKKDYLSNVYSWAESNDLICVETSDYRNGKCLALLSKIVYNALPEEEKPEEEEDQ